MDRVRSRQKKVCKDIIKEQIDLNFGGSQRTVEERSKLFQIIGGVARTGNVKGNKLTSYGPPFLLFCTYRGFKYCYITIQTAFSYARIILYFKWN